MESLPHRYLVTAAAGPDGLLSIDSAGLPQLAAAPPAEFDGPGDQWSPETMLMSAVAACFVLSFRAVASASKLEWVSLSCTSEGVLERIEKVTRFTQVTTSVELVVNNAEDAAKAEKLLEKAEAICLVANSLQAQRSLICDISVVAS